MQMQQSEVKRKHLPGTKEFVFLQGNQVVAKERIDASGSIHVEGRIPDGVVKSYYEDDQGNETQALFAEWHYENGKLEGISRIYYENGLLEEEVVYACGRIQEVLKKHYDENGQLSFETRFDCSSGTITYAHHEKVITAVA